MTESPVLVVLGLSPTGLYVVREAAACGVKVEGYSDALECAASSRYLSNAGRATVLDGHLLERKLLSLAHEHPQVGVIPTTDRHTDFLIERAERWPKNLYMAGAYGSGAGQVGLDKSSITAAAQAAGLLVPGEYDLAHDTFQPGADDFPLILKPKSIHRQRHWLKGRKLFLVESSAEWDRIFAMEPFHSEEWTVQTLIPGPESNIHVAAIFRSVGGDHVTFTARKLRQYPINFGSASLLVSDDDEQVADQARILLEAMEFEGIAGVEFKRDARDGTLVLIEMNPRPSLWFSASTAHGEYLVHRQLMEWFGDGVSRPRLARHDKVTWRYGLKDRLAARAHRRSSPIASVPSPDTSAAAVGETVWAVYQQGDSRPAMAELSAYARKAMQRLGS